MLVVKDALRGYDGDLQTFLLIERESVHVSVTAAINVKAYPSVTAGVNGHR